MKHIFFFVTLTCISITQCSLEERIAKVQEKITDARKNSSTEEFAATANVKEHCSNCGGGCGGK